MVIKKVHFIKCIEIINDPLTYLASFISSIGNEFIYKRILFKPENDFRFEANTFQIDWLLSK